MNTVRKVIGFDLDDVLLDFNSALCKYHNSKYGTSYVRNDVNTYSIEKIWGCTVEEAIRRIKEFYKTPEHFEARPVLGAVDGVKKLSEVNRVVIATAKPETLRDITLGWLDRYFSGIFKDVYFTGHFFGESGNKITKGKVCEEQGIDIFVEDSLHNAEDISAAGKPVILLDSPWNQGELKQNITRVYSWDEIVEKLN